MKKINLIIIVCLIQLSLQAQTGQWTWVHGPQNGNNNLGNYGTKGVEDINNIPPGRYQAAYWTDLNGDFWVFGGYNHKTGDTYNDLWRFRPSTQKWTWMHGPQYATNTIGNLGTIGVPSPLNCPSARAWGANCWTGKDGNLYLYGGSGTTFSSEELVWMYNVTTNEWTWIWGNTGITIANYGLKGVENVSNSPGGRQECKSSFVIDDKLWFFGGQGNAGDQNDVWRFNTANKQWTWMAGNNGGIITPSYGIKGIEDATNNPPGRWSYTKWKDKDNNFYIFAGGSTTTLYNDVWRFNTANNLWTWVSGTNTTGDPGNVNAKCDKDVNNVPKSRLENQTAQTFTDCSSAFWSFGGFTSTGSESYNDLWIYDTKDNRWTLVWGNLNQQAVNTNYGTLGVANANNAIPARGGLCIWTDKNENLWIFGGADFSSSSNLILFNDTWKFVPDTTCYNIIAANSGFSWPEDFILCQNEFAQIQFPPNTDVVVNPSNASSYNQNTGKLILNPIQTTTFSITATSNSNTACPFSETKDIVVKIKPNPVADFVFSPNYATISNPLLSAINRSTDATKYYWYYLNSLISNDKDVIKRYDEVGDICLTLVAENECGLDTATHCALIEADIVLPSAFSPNGDGLNDIYRIIANGPVSLESFSIYNRWGQKVFETNNIKKGWDGKLKGIECEIGTYFYLVELKRGENKTKKLQGDFTLIR